MPVVSPILVTVISDFAINAGRTVWSKTAWARDKAKVDAVEARIRRLITDATESARNLTDESLEPSIERLLSQFQRDLVALGLTAEEAADLTKVQREQILATVVETSRERRQLAKWIKELESRAEASQTALAKHDKEMERITALERQVGNLKLATAVCFTLSVVATLIAVLLVAKP